MKSLVVAFLFAFVSFQAFAKSSEEHVYSGQYDKALRSAYEYALKGNSSDAFVTQVKSPRFESFISMACN